MTASRPLVAEENTYNLCWPFRWSHADETAKLNQTSINIGGTHPK